MNPRVLVALTIFVGAAALAACATQPPPAAAAAAATATVVPASATGTHAKAMKSAYGNYVRVVRGGQTMYCQQDKDTSTRMIHEVCMSEDQMREQQEHARNFMQDAQIASPPISGPNVR